MNSIVLQKKIIVDLNTRKQNQQSARKIYSKKNLLLFSTILAALVAGFVLSGFPAQKNGSAFLNKSNQQALGFFPLVEPTIKFGFVTDTLAITEDIIQPNQFLADILLKHKVNYQTIDQIARASKDVFDVRDLRADKPYMVVAKDTIQMADYFVYEPSVFKYVVYNLKNPSDIKIIERPIETVQKSSSGIIESSLWNTMVDNGLSYELTAKMEDALAWSIDFHHIAKGDKFKLVYDEQLIDGKVVGVGDVYAAYYKNFDNEYHAIYFENEKHNGFFDLEGRSMKKAFLKSPVKFSRISSRYNKRRFHPILKRVKPHLGTDYAAPKGTPILAVADGVVIQRGYGKGNGNYIKLKHDASIQTQYLHMSKFKKGVTKGTHVKQGQVIGYVGSTGLATGPHVCFRFWKNGRQVNHLKQNLPPPDPMPKEDLPRYYEVRDKWVKKLDAIGFKEIKPKEEIVQDSTVLDP